MVSLIGITRNVVFHFTCCPPKHARTYVHTHAQTHAQAYMHACMYIMYKLTHARIHMYTDRNTHAHRQSRHAAFDFFPVWKSTRGPGVSGTRETWLPSISAVIFAL